MRLIDANELITRIESYIERKAITEKDAEIFELICGLINTAQTVAVNCKDCDGYEEGYSAGLKDAEKPQAEWIPVSERLPDKDGCYLVTLEGVEDYEFVDNVDIARFVFSEKEDCNNGFHKAYIVTAWQPLPETYKKEDTE